MKKIEKPGTILDIVKKILGFNKEIQSGGGLKILTPDQILSRLPITLAQLKAGNNSEKLKNEIRQLLCSLHTSKNLTEQLYKSLTLFKMETIFMTLKIVKQMNHTDLNWI